MSGFLNLNRSRVDEGDEYSAVADDERKGLTTEYEHEPEIDHQNAAETYALNRTIRRTNLYLKIIVGLLVLCILSLLSLQGPDAYRKLKHSTSTLLPSPVPNRMCVIILDSTRY